MTVAAPSKFENYLDRPNHLKSHFLKPDLMPWMDSPFKGIQFKTLFEDKDSGMSTLLVKLEPGAVVPLHEHTAFEQTYVLQGSLEDDEGTVYSGEFVWRPGGNIHEAVAPNGALIISVFMKPNEFHSGAKFFTEMNS
jgi:anti-sigma factor ChrR (cupin superfamily)